MRDTFDQRTAAIFGVITTLTGLLIAVAFIPTDPATKGALILPASILAAAILSVPAVRMLNGSRDMLNAENFTALAYVYWILLDPIQGAYDLYGASDDAIKYTLIAVGISAAAMWVGVFGRAWHMPRSCIEVVSKPLETSAALKIVPVSFLLGMLNYMYAVDFNLVQMFSYLGGNRWSAPWARGELGGWDAFLDHAQYFGYVLPSLAALVIVRRGWFKWESWLTIGAAVIMVLFLAQGGGRRVVGVTVGAAILVWVLSQPKLDLRKMLAVAVATFGLLSMMQFMLEIRSEGYENYTASSKRLEYLHVDDNFLRLAQIIDIVPAEHPYVYLKQIGYALVRPIPRIFWEGKPTDPGFDLADTLGLKGVSLSSSIVGEWYLCFGWVAVILGGWLHGRLACAVNGLLEGKLAANNPIVFGLAVMVLVAGVRSMLDLVVMSYAVLAWYGVAWLIAHRSRHRTLA